MSVYQFGSFSHFATDKTFMISSKYLLAVTRHCTGFWGSLHSRVLLVQKGGYYLNFSPVFFIFYVVLFFIFIFLEVTSQLVIYHYHY